VAKLYDKNGKEYEIPHAVDVRDWLEDGYSLEDPKDNIKEPMTTEEFEGIKENLGSLNADELQRVAVFVDVEYTNKRDTLKAIKEKLEA